MTILKKSVMLLKVQSEAGEVDQYEEILLSHNFLVMQVNTLVFEFHGLNALKEKLTNSSAYTGLLLSSPRCVEAISLTLKALNLDELDASWKTKQNYVVGEATHRIALQKLGINCSGKESGNAKNLAEIVAKENKGTQKPFLFPHGNLKTGVLKVELEKSNITIEEVLVYDTLPNPNIEKEFNVATKNGSEIPEYVIFFSPSGVRSGLKLLKELPEYLDKIKFIAIGPVTEMAMKEENLRISGVATNPNPKEVLKLCFS